MSRAENDNIIMEKHKLLLHCIAPNFEGWNFHDIRERSHNHENNITIMHAWVHSDFNLALLVISGMANNHQHHCCQMV